MCLVVFGGAGGCAFINGRRQLAKGLGVLALVACLVAVMCFRVPSRRVTLNPEVLLAPADGWVIGVKDYHEDQALKVDVLRISVFVRWVDPFGAHLPAAGAVKERLTLGTTRYPAFQERASDTNRRTVIVVESPGGRHYAVCQISGVLPFLALNDVEPGQNLDAGARIGRLLGGGRVDILAPKAAVRVCVKTGDRVRAGETVIAQWRR